MNSEIIERMDEDFPNKVVYHYCSVETFKKIIENATLRATNIRKSNDYSEVINTIDCFSFAMRIAIRKYADEYPDDVIFKEFTRGDELDTDELIRKAIDNPTCTYYCTCFSEARDLLSQWRGYADDGKGVAIGFTDAYFKELTNYCRSKYMPRIKYRPIVYDPGKMKADLVKYIVNRFRITHDTRGTELSCSDYESTVNLVLNSMVYNAVFCKNAAFSEEKERRLAFYPFGSIRNLERRSQRGSLGIYQLYYDRMNELDDYEDHYKGIRRGPIQFDEINNKIVSYVDFSFKDILPYCIKEIVLGPKNIMDDLDLRLFLIKHGIDLGYTRITRSEATYR